MEVLKRLVPTFKRSIKCPYPMTPEVYVVHNTYNDASAINEIAYMTNNDRQVSFHYAIDDKQIVQGIEEDRNAWHAGDGATGKGNRKGIGVEICYSKSGGARFIEAERLAAKFIAKGLTDKKWPIDRVTKHQDYSGKYCPHRTLDLGWARFIKMIEREMEPEHVKILRAKTSSPQAWIDFVDANRSHPTGKWLPDLIVKLNQK